MDLEEEEFAVLHVNFELVWVVLFAWNSGSIMELAYVVEYYKGSSWEIRFLYLSFRFDFYWDIFIFHK